MRDECLLHSLYAVYFREPAGGMKSVRKPSSEHSDAGVLNGATVDHWERTIRPLVPLHGQDTSGSRRRTTLHVTRAQECMMERSITDE